MVKYYILIWYIPKYKILLTATFEGLASYQIPSLLQTIIYFLNVFSAGIPSASLSESPLPSSLVKGSPMKFRSRAQLCCQGKLIAESVGAAELWSVI